MDDLLKLQSLSPFIPLILGRRQRRDDEGVDEVAIGFIALFDQLLSGAMQGKAIRYEDQRTAFQTAVEQVLEREGKQLPPNWEALASAYTAQFRDRMADRFAPAESIELTESRQFPFYVHLDSAKERISLNLQSQSGPAAPPADTVVLEFRGGKRFLGLSQESLVALTANEKEPLKVHLRAVKPSLFALFKTRKAFEDILLDYYKERRLPEGTYDGLLLGVEAFQSAGTPVPAFPHVTTSLSIDISPALFRWSTYLRDQIMANRDSHLRRPSNLEKMAALRPLRIGLLCELEDPEDESKPVYMMLSRIAPNAAMIEKPYFTFTIRTAAELISMDDWDGESHKGISLEGIASKMLYEEAGVRTSERDVQFFGCALTDPGTYFKVPDLDHFRTPLVYGVVRPKYFDMETAALCSPNKKRRRLSVELFKTIFKFRKNKSLLPDDAFDDRGCILRPAEIPSALETKHLDDILKLLLAQLYCFNNQHTSRLVKGRNATEGGI